MIKTLAVMGLLICHCVEDTGTMNHSDRRAISQKYINHLFVAFITLLFVEKISVY